MLSTSSPTSPSTGRCLTILQMGVKKPLSRWSKQVRNGSIRRILDEESHCKVVELLAKNINLTFMTCPSDPTKTLGIRLPFIVFFIKNLKKFVTLEIQVLDDRNIRRRFSASTLFSSTRVRHHWCSLPIKLEDGWNVVQFDLSDFTRRAYGTNYVETTRIQVHASCRLRRIYFAEMSQTGVNFFDNFRLAPPDSTTVDDDA